MRIFLMLLVASLAGCADETRKAREADEQREIEEIRAHLQAVAADNGLVWLSELNAAWEHADAPSVTRAVAKIGASRHISIYWNSLIVMMVDAFGEKSTSSGRPVFAQSPTDRVVHAIGILAAVSIPPLQALAKSCRADQFDQHGRREACEAMMARLADSDNVLMQSLAVSIQQKWWPKGSLEREQLRARRRQLDYVMAASSRMRVLHLGRDSARRLEAMRESNHELDVMRAMLVFHHEPLEPPANWKDPYARPE